LAVICGSIDFLMWIKVEVEHRSCLLKSFEKILILRTPKDESIVPIQSMELQRTHIQYPISPWNSTGSL
jgi:hypothetical protein